MKNELTAKEIDYLDTFMDMVSKNYVVFACLDEEDREELIEEAEEFLDGDGNHYVDTHIKTDTQVVLLEDVPNMLVDFAQKKVKEALEEDRNKRAKRNHLLQFHQGTTSATNCCICGKEKINTIKDS